ncbi:lytic murein transglycosylase [Telmatospirillum sp. J64-1]|uniref:lytic murein transglycosylase n=1 Tax=Telmatospirillum sp. J64-1 TaxID=2502183 RepID=UPI00115D843A|nr:lytic murein transglycosylase [Telmatospirillum sp. J64-1]
MSRSICGIACGLAVVLAACASSPLATAQDGQESFASCKARLAERAVNDGVPQAVVSRAFTGLLPDEAVLQMDRRQPEFVQTFWQYLDRRVTPQRIEKGRQLLAQHRPLLDRVAAEHGVQPEILVSFWAHESAFGEHTGDKQVVRSLVTLACDDRRPEFFARETVHALHILAEGAIPAERMAGSWAGAMGQTQFMPSTFRQWAVDGDGDGRRDLWGSLPDVFMSSGNYLRNIGWRAGQPWGQEVILPPDFDLSQASLNNRRSPAEWEALGIRPAAGGALADEPWAAIILPQGVHGPAFALYPNFDVILKWNRSVNYAVAVGVLADRLAGGGPLVAVPPPGSEPLRVEDVVEIQSRLNELGFEAGPADGMPGLMTQGAIRAWQASIGLPADGYPDRSVLERLRQSSPKDLDANS